MNKKYIPLYDPTLMNPPYREAQIKYKGNYKGYRYVVLSLGSHPCAYVKVPNNSRIRTLSCDNIEESIAVHGGVTFYGDLTRVGIGSIDDYYIGWDYAHCDDYMLISSYTSNGKKWELDEVVEECISAVKQLIELEDKI